MSILARAGGATTASCCSYSRVRLFVVRHAEAAPGEPDDLRTLTPHGRSRRGSSASASSQDGSSRTPCSRARCSAHARRPRESRRRSASTPEPDERLAPGATADDVRAVVAGRGETVVVVGHQPDCGQIVAAIDGGPAPEFPAGGVRELEL